MKNYKQENIELNMNFDFTTDTPMFWETYWNDEMGGVFVDPDSESNTLKKYHQLLWSKQLPNGEFLNLVEGDKKQYLIWKNFRFSSDSIIVSFRYNKYRHMIKQVMNHLPNYKKFMEDYTRRSYTIGGSIIFPKLKGSINQMRGCNPFIIDRFDLTLECIRKYYMGEPSPLTSVLGKNKNFFDLFVNFKGYVEFFYLQDLVSDDFAKVIFWLGDGSFKKHPFPQNVEEYLIWIEKQLDFVRKRNLRIEIAYKNKKLV